MEVYWRQKERHMKRYGDRKQPTCLQKRQIVLTFRARTWGLMFAEHRLCADTGLGPGKMLQTRHTVPTLMEFII